MQNRVAVTGIGAICGLGQNLSEIWPALIEGKSGISQVNHFDISTLKIQIAGEVKDFSISENLLSAREAPRFDRFIHFALKAAAEALTMAGIENIKKYYSPFKIGNILGVGMGGFPEIENTHSTFLNKGARRISPFYIPAVIPNMAPGIIALKFGMQGINYSISSACASATHAISAACYEIASGRQDVMLTGGAEGVISNLGMGGFVSMKALSGNIADPTLASRPFDKNRDGFVIGEGAGTLVLENYDKALERGANILAEVVGHGTTCDAFHITAPHPEGVGATECMKMALKSANLSPQDIDHINAHGTSTPLGDIAETKAIKQCFGGHAKNIAINSTKSMIGHLLGAAGGIESVFIIKSLNESIIPPTINLDNQDDECDLDYTANKALKKDIQYGLNNSFGFGGTNATTIYKKV